MLNGEADRRESHTQIEELCNQLVTIYTKMKSRVQKMEHITHELGALSELQQYQNLQNVSVCLLELSHPNTQQYFIHLTAVPVLFLLYSTVFFYFIYSCVLSSVFYTINE